MFTDAIYQGVSVADIPLGGLTVQDAQDKITKVFNERIANRAIIVIKYGDSDFLINSQDINLDVDAAKLAQEAYNIGRTGNIIHRLQERYLTINNGRIIPLTVLFDKDTLSDKLNNIALNIDCEPHNASLIQQGTNITVIPEIVGLKVDVQKNLDKITNHLDTNFPFTMNLIVNELVPDITSKDLEGIDSVISSFTTEFDLSDQNRTQNIILAANKINGTLVKSQEVFSFNDQVGLRLPQYGYKEAPVYIDNKLEIDWGGGVCQVSSTLYNAVLLADMSIEERTPHFRPPGYLPLGLDATVADNALDFKFKNTSPNNIYLKTDISSNQITVYVLGKKNSLKYDINIITTDKSVIEPNTIVKQDPQLDLGREVVETEGQKGFYVTSYRIKSLNGQEIRRERLASDEFKPIDKIIIVGTKVPDAKSK
jgi:vancomycin resistance protein YoaR